MLRRTDVKGLFRGFEKQTETTIELDVRTRTVRNLSSEGKLQNEVSVESARDVFEFIKFIQAK